MSSNIQPTITVPTLKPRKKKAIKTSQKNATVSFPVDFFEHCQPINDVEIGGNDLLQVYNVAQLKHRLNTAGLYVVCNKPLGFTLEVTNPDNNMVMTGKLVLCCFFTITAIYKLHVLFLIQLGTCINIFVLKIKKRITFSVCFYL